MSITIDHAGKVALVTGAGAGIGREIARWLARAGAAVAVNDARAEKAAETVASIEAEGGRAIAVVADCRDDAQVERMVAAHRRRARRARHRRQQHRDVGRARRVGLHRHGRGVLARCRRPEPDPHGSVRTTPGAGDDRRRSWWRDVVGDFGGDDAALAVQLRVRGVEGGAQPPGDLAGNGTRRARHPR